MPADESLYEYGGFTPYGEEDFPETTLVLVAPQLYERYTSYFGNDFKIEVPLKEWQEYTLNQIDAARRTINALSDEDNADLATVINIIKMQKCLMKH